MKWYGFISNIEEINNIKIKSKYGLVDKSRSFANDKCVFYVFGCKNVQEIADYVLRKYIVNETESLETIYVFHNDNLVRVYYFEYLNGCHILKFNRKKNEI